MNNQSIYDNAPTYYHYYFKLLETNDLMLELEKDRARTIEFLENIPAEKEHFAYQEGKWTVNQVVRHIIDTERIMAYRALRFSRLDATDLPGFDENFYIESISNHIENRADLIEEFNAVRLATFTLFKSMTGEMLSFVGNANKQKCSTEALGFFIVGHNLHHSKVLKERYLL